MVSTTRTTMPSPDHEPFPRLIHLLFVMMVAVFFPLASLFPLQSVELPVGEIEEEEMFFDCCSSFGPDSDSDEETFYDCVETVSQDCLPIQEAVDILVVSSEPSPIGFPPSPEHVVIACGPVSLDGPESLSTAPQYVTVEDEAEVPHDIISTGPFWDAVNIDTAGEEEEQLPPQAVYRHPPHLQHNAENLPKPVMVEEVAEEQAPLFFTGSSWDAVNVESFSLQCDDGNVVLEERNIRAYLEKETLFPLLSAKRVTVEDVVEEPPVAQLMGQHWVPHNVVSESIHHLALDPRHKVVFIERRGLPCRLPSPMPPKPVTAEEEVEKDITSMATGLFWEPCNALPTVSLALRKLILVERRTPRCRPYYAELEARLFPPVPVTVEDAVEDVMTPTGTGPFWVPRNIPSGSFVSSVLAADENVVVMESRGLPCKAFVLTPESMTMDQVAVTVEDNLVTEATFGPTCPILAGPTHHCGREISSTVDDGLSDRLARLRVAVGDESEDNDDRSSSSFIADELSGWLGRINVGVSRGSNRTRSQSETLVKTFGVAEDNSPALAVHPTPRKSDVTHGVRAASNDRAGSYKGSLEVILHPKECKGAHRDRARAIHFEPGFRAAFEKAYNQFHSAIDSSMPIRENVSAHSDEATSSSQSGVGKEMILHPAYSISARGKAAVIEGGVESITVPPELPQPRPILGCAPPPPRHVVAAPVGLKAGSRRPVRSLKRKRDRELILSSPKKPRPDTDANPALPDAVMFEESPEEALEKHFRSYRTTRQIPDEDDEATPEVQQQCASPSRSRSSSISSSTVRSRSPSTPPTSPSSASSPPSPPSTPCPLKVTMVNISCNRKRRHDAAFAGLVEAGNPEHVCKKPNLRAVRVARFGYNPGVINAPKKLPEPGAYERLYDAYEPRVHEAMAGMDDMGLPTMHVEEDEFEKEPIIKARPLPSSVAKPLWETREEEEEEL